MLDIEELLGALELGDTGLLTLFPTWDVADGEVTIEGVRRLEDSADTELNRDGMLMVAGAELSAGGVLRGRADLVVAVGIGGIDEGLVLELELIPSPILGVGEAVTGTLVLVLAPPPPPSSEPSPAPNPLSAEPTPPPTPVNALPTGPPTRLPTLLARLFTPPPRPPARELTPPPSPGATDATPPPTPPSRELRSDGTTAGTAVTSDPTKLSTVPTAPARGVMICVCSAATASGFRMPWYS